MILPAKSIIVFSLAVQLLAAFPACAQTNRQQVAAAQASEMQANTMAIPNPILATGSDLNSGKLSPNAIALAKQLNVYDQLANLPNLRARAASGNSSDRMESLDQCKNVSEQLRQTELDVSYTLSEILDEQGLYTELIGSYSSERDKLIAYTNMVNWGTNGALWAIAEAYDIPTYHEPRLALQSGIFGILGGIVPSFAAFLTLKEVAGRKHSAPASPNSLSQLFDRPASHSVQFPDSVWTFLNSPPADNPNKKRKELIIDRWVADSNLSELTNRTSGKQIDALCGTTEQKKSVTLSLLSSRNAMLSQLASEIFKMQRLLNELEMSLRGQKSV
jgi:hypothetical protein